MHKPSVINAPSGGAPEKAPRWDLMGTEGCGGGTRFSWCPLMFSGYVGIYKRKKYVGGPHVAPPTYFFLLYIPTYPQTNTGIHENLIPPPQPSVPVRSHHGAISGTPPEGDSIMEGLYTKLAALSMMCELCTMDLWVHSY